MGEDDPPAAQLAAVRQQKAFIPKFDWFLIPPDNPLLPGINRCLRPVSQVQFAQYIADMPFDRMHADHQLRGDFTIARTIGNQL